MSNINSVSYFPTSLLRLHASTELPSYWFVMVSARQGPRLVFLAFSSGCACHYKRKCQYTTSTITRKIGNCKQSRIFSLSCGSSGEKKDHGQDFCFYHKSNHKVADERSRLQYFLQRGIEGHMKKIWRLWAKTTKNELKSTVDTTLMRAGMEHSSPTNSQTLRYMWFEFVVDSCPCSERFFSACSGFPLFSKTTFPNFNSICRVSPYCKVHLDHFVTKLCAINTNS